MLMLSTALIVAEAATAPGNLPKRIDFSLPKALTSEELGLAPDSNILVTDGTRISKGKSDGILVQQREVGWYSGPVW